MLSAIAGLMLFASCQKDKQAIKPIQELQKAKITLVPKGNHEKSQGGPDDDESPVIQGIQVVYQNNPVAHQRVNLFKGLLKMDSTYTDDSSKFKFTVPRNVYSLEIKPNGKPSFVTDEFAVTEDVDIIIDL